MGSPTDIPTMNPTVNDGAQQFGEENGANNETLYMVLAIVFGLLFCCMLGLLAMYFWKKNKTQRDEVDFNNAHIVLAGSPMAKDDDAIEGHTLQTTQAQGTAGGSTVNVDASDGIVAFGSTKGMHTADDDEEVVAASSYKGIDGMSELDEDDQKQNVMSYNM